MSPQPIRDCLIPCGAVDLLPSNQKLALVEKRLTDDATQAALVVETNLEQRERLLPSEKGFAYKLQIEVLQRGDDSAIK